MNFKNDSNLNNIDRYNAGVWLYENGYRPTGSELWNMHYDTRKGYQDSKFIAEA